MTYHLILRPEAEKDLLDAYRWYDRRVSGLGLRFIESVELTLTQVESAVKSRCWIRAFLTVPTRLDCKRHT